MILKRMLDFPNYGWRSAFDDLERMRRDMDRLFGQVVGRNPIPGVERGHLQRIDRAVHFKRHAIHIIEAADIHERLDACSSISPPPSFNR